MHVGAGAETAPGTGDHDPDDRLVGLGSGHRVTHLVVHRRHPGIERLRPIEGDERDRVVDLVGDELVGHDASSRVLDGAVTVIGP